MKTRAHHPPEDELARTFRRLTRAAERVESQALAAAGMPRAQAHALLAVASMARPAMAMVARELDLAPSTVTRLLDPLVRRGLVRREADPDDRRVIVVALTAAGRQTAERLAIALERAYARVAAAAGAGGRRRLLSSAREILGAIEQQRPIGGASGAGRAG
jgi:DNA-binding MarR family transcriptional regulator